jgi:hypothetical protein
VICIIDAHPARVRCNVTIFRWVLFALVCLGITERGTSWAEPAHDHWVDDPYAPHKTSGTTARIGTAVGFLYGELVDASALGLTAAFGHRFGRFAIEAELAYLSLNPRGPSSQRIGDAERLGVVGRFDVVRIGPE